jgi:hypothetical protein
MDISKMEDLGMEDLGKWVPFIFKLDIVEAAKMTSDDNSMDIYGCTTLFTVTGDSYIIDTPYKEFFQIFKAYVSNIDTTTDSDLEL